jgi:hypothetical protein
LPSSLELHTLTPFHEISHKRRRLSNQFPQEMLVFHIFHSQAGRSYPSLSCSGSTSMPIPHFIADVCYHFVKSAHLFDVAAFGALIFASAVRKSRWYISLRTPSIGGISVTKEAVPRCPFPAIPDVRTLPEFQSPLDRSREMCVRRQLCAQQRPGPGIGSVCRGCQVPLRRRLVEPPETAWAFVVPGTHAGAWREPGPVVSELGQTSVELG